MPTIVKTAEFRRIDALPRRIWTDRAPYYAQSWTQALKTPQGTMQLYPVQGALIQESQEMGGAVGAIAVGAGKSVLALLLPIALQAKRPLLIIPAALKQQTLTQVIPYLSKHWLLELSAPLELVSYTWISSLAGQNFLDDYKPDLIIADEAHKFKNLQTARTRRFIRYFRDNRTCKFVVLSGSITKDSLLDYYHLMHLALGDNAPIPCKYKEVSNWDLCLSPKAESFYFRKIKPGALLTWNKLNPRAGYLRRLQDTKGVICTSDSSIGTSLIIRKRKVLISPKITKALSDLKTDWILPNGRELWDILEYTRYAKQLSYGFYYERIGKPPKDWSIARREWMKWCRGFIKFNKRGIDSPSALIAYFWNDPPIEYLAWIEVKDNYKPQVRPIWYDETIMHQIVDWIDKDHDSLFWTDTIAIGEKVALSGIPYFGSGQEIEYKWPNGNRESIMSGNICLSIGAHGEGKNLQFWANNYIITCPSSGKTWEQLIGRTHRPGQKADEVIIDVLIHTPIQERSFSKAISEARYIQETTGQRQKLLLARVI